MARWNRTVTATTARVGSTTSQPVGNAVSAWTYPVPAHCAGAVSPTPPTPTDTAAGARVSGSGPRASSSDAYRAAAEAGPLSKVLVYSDAPLVSSDIVGSPASCTFDSGLTMAMGNLVKVLGWYDNEWGYSNRLADLTLIVGAANQ